MERAVKEMGASSEHSGHASPENPNLRLVIAIGGLMLLIPLFATPVLPFIDLYNHIARYFVLAHLADNPFLAENYIAAWALLPNLGLDVIATPLLNLVEPLPAAKMIIGAILLLQYGGVLYLHAGLFGRASFLPAALLTVVLYSFILSWGFINFLLGLALVFWVLGLWVRLRGRPYFATCVCGAGAVLIFFCHGLAFAIYGILLGGLELGRFLDQSERRLSDLIRRAGLLIMQAVVPVGLFLSMPTSKAKGVAGSLGNSIDRHLAQNTFADQIQFEFLYRIRTIVRVAESPYALLDYVSFALLTGLLVTGLIKGWFRVHKWMWPAIGFAFILCIITPPSLFGVGYVADRMPLVFALTLIASVVVVSDRPRVAIWAVAVFALIAPVRLVATTIGFSNYRAHYADFRYLAEAVPEGALVASVMNVGRDRRDGLVPRCQMYPPLLVPMNDAAVALFANPTQQPLLLTGRLAEARASQPSTSDPRVGPIEGFFDDRLDNIAEHRLYDYVLMCGREKLDRPLPKGMHIVRERGGITLLSVDR